MAHRPEALPHETERLISWRLMERLGMRREAHFRQSHQVRGEWDDESVYALLAEEWSRMPASEGAG
jgi:RimJ/RimL family protein N-acetyltransferase